MLRTVIIIISQFYFINNSIITHNMHKRRFIHSVQYFYKHFDINRKILLSI